jgi:DNA-binding response OmpR family regulator
VPQGILIVEDEDVLANNIKLYMEGHGYEAKIAGTGAEGLQEIEAFKPDLALLDFHLPDINGLDILKKIRTAEPTIKVILITGQGNVQLAVDAMKAGASVVFPSKGGRAEWRWQDSRRVSGDPAMQATDRIPAQGRRGS